MSTTVITSELAIRSVTHVEKPEPDEFKKIADILIERIIPSIELYRSKHIIIRPVIAIAGCSGVGKSCFSELLNTHLHKNGINAKILHFDDFLDPEPFEGALEEIHPRFNYHKAHAFLQKSLNGEEIIEKPAWDNTGIKPFKIKEFYNLKDVELLIFEGEFTLCDSKTYDFLQFSNLRVIIDADMIDIIRWDWERALYLETDSFAEFTALRTKPLTKYRALLESLKPYADFVIKKESNHEFFLETQQITNNL